jgi:hypothetical protein
MRKEIRVGIKSNGGDGRASEQVEVVVARIQWFGLLRRYAKMCRSGIERGFLINIDLKVLDQNTLRTLYVVSLFMIRWLFKV